MHETCHCCPHYTEKDSISIFHRHKKLFYKEEFPSWMKKSDVLSDFGSESHDSQVPVQDGFSSDGSSCSETEGRQNILIC